LDVRGDLIVAIFIGVTFERYVIGAGGLAELDPAELESHVAGLLRHVLEPVLPRSRPRTRDGNIERPAPQ
jgi:hypothetical protein